MRIAQVSPLFESVPPKYYGGTERVVSYLTEELVRQGHEVTLFASGDSSTRAELVSCCPSALRLGGASAHWLSHHLTQVEKLYQSAASFDVIHFHLDYCHYPMAIREKVPHVTTQHGRLDFPELKPLYRLYRNVPLISISDSQREPLPGVNWQGTVHHGLPADMLSFHRRPGKYLAFLGRLSPEKGVDQAIRISLELGMELKIAAKLDTPDLEYYEAEVKPLLEKSSLLEYIGEIGDAEKDDFLGNAQALIFPIDWPEPFGLVMIEAMACGTPTIAYSRGSVPEVLEDGVTGFIVPDADGAVKAATRLDTLDRSRVRQVFEERFTAERMAADYLSVYRQLLVDVPESEPVGASPSEEAGS